MLCSVLPVDTTTSITTVQTTTTAATTQTTLPSTPSTMPTTSTTATTTPTTQSTSSSTTTSAQSTTLTTTPTTRTTASTTPDPMVAASASKTDVNGLTFKTFRFLVNPGNGTCLLLKLSCLFNNNVLTFIKLLRNVLIKQINITCVHMFLFTTISLHPTIYYVCVSNDMLTLMTTVNYLYFRYIRTGCKHHSKLS